MTKIRIITGLIVAGGWLLLLFYGPFWLFWLVFFGLGGLALKEYNQMTLSQFGRFDQYTGIILGLFPLLAVYGGNPETVAAALFLSLFFLIAYILYRYSSMTDSSNQKNGFELMLRIGFGIFYVGFSFSHFTLLLTLPQGKNWLILLTVITVFSDSAAYFVGKHLGRHKLAPAISPGKTVEGLFGGLTGSILGAIIVCLLAFPEVAVLKIVLLTIFLSLVGVMGDLTESVIKRTMGVKDSGHLLPGHGGVLDRLDSLMIAAPVLFYMLHFGLLSV